MSFQPIDPTAIASPAIDHATLRFARRLARIKAYQLCVLLRRESVEDIEQELLLEVVAAWGRYDAARGGPEPFIERLVKQKAWKILRDRRYGAGRTGDVAFQLGDHDRPDPADDIGASDMRHDVALVTGRLAPALRETCDRLRHEPMSTVARRKGVPRSTLVSSLGKARLALASAGLNQYLS